MTEAEKNQITEFRDKGFGYKKIAQTMGISINTVKSFCKKLEYVAAETSITQCLQCGADISQVAGRKEKKFCSDKCRMNWWNSHQDQVKRKAIYEFICPTCGTHFTAYGNSHRKYCSCKCYIIARYRGGRK